MTDSYVQVPDDSTGKKVATTQVTRADASVVEYQDVQVRALVTDVPLPLIGGNIEPLSMTNQGRLRVSTVTAEIERVWQHTASDPWGTLRNQWDLAGESLHV